jgi:hypothetical protein
MRLVAAGLCAVLLWAVLPMPQARATEPKIHPVYNETDWDNLNRAVFTGNDVIVIHKNIAATNVVTLNIPSGGSLTLRSENGATISRASSSFPPLPPFTFLEIASEIAGDDKTSVLIENLTFIGAESRSTGGALSVKAGTVTVKNCNFKGNSAPIGAGGAMNIIGDAIMTDCVFEKNYAEYGGALGIDGNATMTDCDFKGNIADSGGGGVYIWNSAAVPGPGGGGDAPGKRHGKFSGCKFLGNKASYTAAISLDGDATIDTCSFGDNDSDSLLWSTIFVHNTVKVIGINIFVNNSTGGNVNSEYGIGSQTYYNAEYYGENPNPANYLVMLPGSRILTVWPLDTRTKQSLPAQVHGFGRQGLTTRVGETVFLPKIQNASLAGYLASASKAGYVELTLTLDGLTIRVLKPGTVQLVLENDATYAVMDVTITS